MYLDLKSILFLALLVAVLICGSILYYKKYIGIYSGFPTVNLLSFIAETILKSNIPKDTPAHAYAFQYLVEAGKRFQKEGVCLIWVFQPYLLVYDEEIYKVLSNESTTINKPYNFDLFKEVCKNSLLTSGGELWRKRRKMLNPVFYTHNLKTHVEMVNKNTTFLVENMVKHNYEASSNIIRFLKDCSFRNMYEFLTGMELPVSEKNPEMEFAIDCVDKGSKMVAYRISKPWLHPRRSLFLFSEGRSCLKMFENGVKYADWLLDKMKAGFLTKKLKKEKEIDATCRNSGCSFAQVFIEQQAKDPSYTHADMQGEVIGLVAAGYDTVAYSMMWSLFLMGHHPDVQEQVYEEVQSVLGDYPELSYENLKHLNYLECVIKESLRLYPPVPFYSRRTVREVTCGKYSVPSGTNIVFFPYLAHRNPEVFPNPEKFDPERFLSGNSDKKFSTYAFAEGVRNCIGKNFAMLEMKTVLAHVIKNFKVTSLDRPEDISLNWQIILNTVKPLRMRFTPRQPSLIQI